MSVCEWCGRHYDPDDSKSKHSYTYCSVRCQFEATGDSEKDEGCFITTAVARAEGKADDCHELTTLRWFRDSYMLATPARATKVETYYRIAPGIVRRLDARPDAPELYAYLRETFIAPALAAIASGDFPLADATYSSMVAWACETSGLKP
jgi:hypothetical protein